MIGRGAQGRPWFPGQLARFLASGVRDPAPPLDRQYNMIAALYDEMLVHHGERIGAKHARKHVAWALDVAAETAGAAASLKHWRGQVLTAPTPRETQRRLADAFDAMAWRVAA